MPVTNLSNRTILTNSEAGTAMRLHSDATTDVPEPLNSIIERLLNMSAAYYQETDHFGPTRKRTRSEYYRTFYPLLRSTHRQAWRRATSNWRPRPDRAVA